jgi:hypothetical protein
MGIFDKIADAFKSAAKAVADTTVEIAEETGQVMENSAEKAKDLTVDAEKKLT